MDHSRNTAKTQLRHRLEMPIPLLETAGERHYNVSQLDSRLGHIT